MVLAIPMPSVSASGHGYNRKAGGLHKFNGWSDRYSPIVASSQVFRSAVIRKLTEEGAHFCSHTTAPKHLFTPEGVVGYTAHHRFGYHDGSR